MSQRIVRITLSNGETTALRGKLADLVVWIIKNQHHLADVHQGELTFNWAQGDNGTSGSFRPTIKSVMSSEKFTS
jgi:hypothetical protein